MLMVMVALSTSIVLAYTLIQTQSVTLHVLDNGLKQNLARDAAETGVSVALRAMNSTTWGGVNGPLSGVFSSDATGTASYAVTFEQANDEPPIESVHASLLVRLRSLGTWQATDGSSRTQAEVVVVVQLLPRLPGRTIAAADQAAVNDVKANPTGYDSIQGYSLATKSSSTALILDPADRIEGSIFLRGGVSLFGDPSWSSTVRTTYLSAIGSRFAAQSTQIQHPHPLTGPITFQYSPTSSLSSDLQRLNTPWTTYSSGLTFPSVNFSDWQQYRLYDGGFQYTAQSLGSTVQSTELQPTASNPLGIYYRSGSLSIRSDVKVEGTIVCTGKVTISGDRISLGGRSWRDFNGTGTVERPDLWPRLPTIVANEVEFDREVSASVDGAIIASSQLYGAGGTFDYESVWDQTITGTATARPLQQPFSEVQLQTDQNLHSLSDGEYYAIWIERQNSGDWFPIVSVNASSKTIKVTGEVSCSAGTPFTIRRGRKEYATIRGPVYADKMNINRPNEWVMSGGAWNTLYNRWVSENNSRARNGLSPLNFSEFIEDPGNFFLLFYSPYTQLIYGLRLEPTFHLRNTTGISYRFAPPLFAPYTGSTYTGSTGYRWKIISWRES